MLLKATATIAPTTDGAVTCWKANTLNKSQGAAKGVILTKAVIRGQIPFVPSDYYVAVATIPSGVKCHHVLPNNQSARRRREGTSAQTDGH